MKNNKLKPCMNDRCIGYNNKKPLDYNCEFVDVQRCSLYQPEKPSAWELWQEIEGICSNNGIDSAMLWMRVRGTNEQEAIKILIQIKKEIEEDELDKNK